METKSKSAAQKVCKGHLKKNTTMFTSEQKILIGMEAICGKFSRLSSVVSIAFIKLQPEVLAKITFSKANLAELLHRRH